MLSKTKSRFLLGKSQIIFTSALIIMGAFFWGCNGKSPDLSKQSEIKDIEDLCSKARGGSFDEEINPACAETSIDAYMEYITSVKVALDDPSFPGKEDKLIRGVRVNREDMIQALSLRDSTHDDEEIYIMMAMKTDESEVVYTDFIFTVQTGQGDTATYKYYDFTQPCPNYCPDKYSVIR